MKKIGFVVLIISIVLLIAAFSMDVSVYSDSGYRVNNIGLMNERQNMIIISAAMSIIGVLLILFGGTGASKTPQSAKEQLSPANAVEYKVQQYVTCPECSGEVRIEAVDCKHCGAFIKK